MDETFKYPRLYVEAPLAPSAEMTLNKNQAHYLKNVLRKKEGDPVRLFNGKDGEWLGRISSASKKDMQITLEKQLRVQPYTEPVTALLFAPVKKARQDILIEKAVELGVTDFYPLLTQNTEVRKLNEERLTAQIFEAAEQCERLSIPKLHRLQKLDTLFKDWPDTLPVFACIERFDAAPLSAQAGNAAIFIGPEGGFTQEEKEFIAAQKPVRPVTLGKTVYRCETAALKALIVLRS